MLHGRCRAKIRIINQDFKRADLNFFSDLERISRETVLERNRGQRHLVYTSIQAWFFSVICGYKTRSNGLTPQRRKLYVLTCGRTSLWSGCQSSGTGYPEGWWSLLLCRYSRLVWTPTCVKYHREPALAGGWTGGSPEVPSNPCDSVI